MEVVHDCGELIGDGVLAVAQNGVAFGEGGLVGLEPAVERGALDARVRGHVDAPMPVRAVEFEMPIAADAGVAWAEVFPVAAGASAGVEMGFESVEDGGVEGVPVALAPMALEFTRSGRAEVGGDAEGLEVTEDVLEIAGAEAGSVEVVDAQQEPAAQGLAEGFG